MIFMERHVNTLVSLCTTGYTVGVTVPMGWENDLLNKLFMV